MITNGGDHAVPGKYKRYLEESKLIAWFGRNVTLHHDKMFSIPLGIPSLRSHRGNRKIFEKIISEQLHKKYLLHSGAFTVRNSPTARAPVFNYFKNKSFCYFPSKKSFAEYLRELAQSKFVLSPEGNGIDCFRTEEAIMIGSIPIVTSSPLGILYKDLPVLIIDSWEEISEEFLKKQYQKMKKQTYNVTKLSSSYWIEQIEEVKKDYWESKRGNNIN